MTHPRGSICFIVSGSFVAKPHGSKLGRGEGGPPTLPSLDPSCFAWISIKNRLCSPFFHSQVSKQASKQDKQQLRIPVSHFILFYFIYLFFYYYLLQHTKRRHLRKNTKKKKIRPLLTTYCTNAKLLTIQYLRFLQIRHRILFTTLTLLTIQYLQVLTIRYLYFL